MKKLCFAFIFLSTLNACEKAEIIPPATYQCSLSFTDQSMHHPKQAEFQAALDEAAQFTPGVQVAIRTPDQLTWTGAAGMADIPNQIPMLACQQTMVGSISKVFTAVLILQLQDEGVLSISDPLSQWLHTDIIGKIENAEEVSLQQLLDHTSGIRDYLSTEQFINAVNTPNFRETQEEKLRYVYGKKAHHAAGTAYSYSNTNYVLLGLVVEVARQMPLWDAVEQFITQPLGLINTRMGTHNAPIPNGTARPYLATRSDKYRDIMHIAVSDAATGDGGIVGNAQDINAFMEALFNGQLLSNDALQLMTGSLVAVGEEADFPQWDNEQYGLGISLFRTPYGDAYGHTGSTSAYNAYLFYFPEQAVTVSIAYNGSSYDDKIEKHKRILRERLFELVF